ncbi:MAG TPA: hypothetical protein PKC55_07515 [Dysgonomonas sp.]|uniref:hypothetical protein n=1 Tax=unclassified Dysgonomonas TaxID=2630389 RepID=UPI0025B888CC|nr:MULTISPECIES: hypothetical protein [unclassified Dysgonomonas]HML64660.1 hypothetical protein [Dysgonomonas sp.]
MKHLINAIEKIAKENPDGFTVTVPNLENVTSGYIAAYLETQNSFNREGLEKVINHSLENGQTVGGWLDTESNLFYYDSCKVFETKSEAVEFGKQNQQIAIFDLNNLKEIRL